MATGKLTEKAINALRSAAKRTRAPAMLWDTELKGFGARAAPDGIQVSWVFQYWMGGKGGKSKRIVFGRLSHMGIEAARKEAENNRSSINKGEPVLDRKARIHKERVDLQTKTLCEVVEIYLAERDDGGRYWQDAKGYFYRDVIPPIGKDTIITAVTKEAVRDALKRKQDKPGSQRFMFTMLRPFFRWCIDESYVAASPMLDLRAPKPAKARDRILTDDEVKTFWKATETMSAYERDHRSLPSPVFGHFYQLLLLTAQRREEVADIAWSEIDLGRATWTIPCKRTKNGKEHTIHLSPQALAVINSIERVHGTDYLLTTDNTTSIRGYGKAKARLDGIMQEAIGEREIEPWRVHDLRRTAASGMAKLGFQPHIVERVLNHISGAQGGLIAVYQRYEYLEERKRAIEAWGSYVEALIVDRPVADNVLPLRR